MAVPKKRASLSRRNKRKANMHIELPELVKCSCGAFRRSHCACAACGKYRGVQVIHKM